LVQAAQKLFAQDPSVRLDYFQIVDPDTLEPVDTISGRALVAVAAYVGNTRLIDNVTLSA
jgi:pantothenate synthetase